MLVLSFAVLLLSVDCCLVCVAAAWCVCLIVVAVVRCSCCVVV